MACNKISAGINARCETSMGGIIEVYIANDSEWNYTEGSTTNTLTVDAVSGTAGAKWYKFTFRKGTSSLNSTLNIDDANGVNYVSSELQMLFGKMDTTKRVAIAALATSELKAIVKDCNGIYWCLGETEPVTASAGEGNTGTARGDSNHYSITLVDNNTSFVKEINKEDFESDVEPNIAA